MEIKQFPILIYAQGSIEVVDDNRDLDDLIFHLTQEEREQVVVYDLDEQCLNLKGEVIDPLPVKKLTQLVKASLAQDGHCCLDKLSTLSVSSAFALLTG